MKINLIKLRNFYKAPSRKHFDDAGADVYSPFQVTLRPHQTVAIGLGFGLDIPNGFCGFVFPRSSLASVGIITQLSPIDAGYHGEIHAITTNTSDKEYTINIGDRIGQIVILNIDICDICEMEGDEQRDKGAFGSTGK
jgi:dUTP pyrophosphatase